MKLRVLALVFSILSTFSLVAQDQFDRLYRTTQRVMTGLDMITDGGENYYVLSHFYEERDTVQGLNITSLDKKGSVSWSRDYFKDTLMFNSINNLGGIIKSGFVALDDGFVVSANIMDNRQDTSVKFTGYDLIFMVDGSGNLEWSQKFKSDNEEATVTSNQNIIQSINDGDLFFNSNRLNGESTSLCNTKFTVDGDLLWSKSYDASIGNDNTILEEISNIAINYDSTYIAIGSIDDDAFTLQMDEEGNALVGRRFHQANLDITPSHLLVLPDSTQLMSAYLQSTNGNVMGGLIKLDTFGNLVWAKEIAQPGGLGTIYINGMVLNEDGSIGVAGNVDIPLNTDESNSEFLINMNTNGVINWQRQYRIIAGKGELRSGALRTTEDGGYAYMTTSYDSGQERDSLMIRMIKLSPTGELDFLDSGGTCHDTISLAINDIEIQQDTLMWNVSEAVDSFVGEVIFAPTFSHEAPILTLPDTVFCPGDPVQFLIDATTPGAVSYEWYKADDPDNIIGRDSIYVATEVDVDYVAEVKIELDNCFMLCDTTRLSDIDPPMVAIGVSAGQLCETNQLVLFAEGSGGTLVWSTGETTSQILIDGPGNYSVTATNECDDTGDASISISENDFLQPIDGEIMADTENCSGGVLALVLTTTGSVANVRWNTGAISTTIAVTEAGTYTATITDICGDQIERSIEITPSEIFGCSDGDCPDGASTAENACLCWPNAFLPASMDENNASFGPNDRCPNISSYNLRVYNRWGQKVFESNNITEEWNGRKGNKDAPSEVYAYYVVYEVEGVEIQDKGHVTLIR